MVYIHTHSNRSPGAQIKFEYYGWKNKLYRPSVMETAQVTRIDVWPCAVIVNISCEGRVDIVINLVIFRK